MTLFDEPCTLKDRVDLPNRIVWQEKGKTVEGCAGANSLGLVLAYFADKSVAAFPVRAFRPVSSI